MKRNKNSMTLATPFALCNLILLLILATRATSYDHYLLNCGSELGSVGSSFDKRTWYSDNNNTFSRSFSSTTATATPSPSSASSSLSAVPFSAARVFATNFTYSFPVSPGPKFIRLFFNPTFISATVSSKDAYLTVQSNSNHLLLRNFSAYLSNRKQDFVEKEFYVYVATSPLQLTFFPSHPGSIAYVNGIEVVSVPDDLYVNQQHSPMNLDSPGNEFTLQDSDALENAYKLNVGGTELNRLQDTGMMYRRWLGGDGDYLIGAFRGKDTTGDVDNSSVIDYTKLGSNYSAPPGVYQTFRWMGLSIPEDIKRKVNVTWEFELDLGFSYLVRLHWCELVWDINSTNYRVFNVYIGGLVAEEQMDVFGIAGKDSAYYKDYVIYMGTAEADRDGSSSRGNLQLSMHPYFDSHPGYWDILLNGLEIFKISKFDGSLNAANPADALAIDKPFQPQKSTTHSNSNFPVIIGIIVGSIFLIAVLCFLLILQRHRYSKTSLAGPFATNSSKLKALFRYAKSGSARKSGSGSSYLPSHLCRHFTLMEIRQATLDFSDSLIVGHGGFGYVYKGTMKTVAGSTLVAVKRLKAHSNQGAREFTMEIQLLSKLRHVNLVSLIGYCNEAGEMILVYEYMSHGTLRDQLQPKNTQLSWLKRLEVCVGAARGLNYLHTGNERMIIHRDVKTANILLDKNWIAKVADFGLSKMGPTGADHSHVSTAVKGSFGYVDPEYFRRQQLTEKSDVYSFGVVLFEVLCGRAAVNPNLPMEQVNLRMWARTKQQIDALDTIVDPNLVGQIAPKSLRKFGEVAESCVRDEGAQRPSMEDVIGGLELSLRLQIEDTMTSELPCHATARDDDGYRNLNTQSPTTDGNERLFRHSSSDASTWMTMNNSMFGKF